MPKVKLKPCPFCGAKAKNGKLPDVEGYYVYCSSNKCRALGPGTRTKQHASINTWNRRARRKG